MPIVLTLEHRAGAGPRETRTLTSGTLSIGRGPGNDWVLADPDRHLSKTHCMVSLEAGHWYVTDLSTNGLYVNGATEATRRDARIELTDGDQFRLGDYVVSVAEQAGAARAAAGRTDATVTSLDPLADPLGGDFLDDPFGQAPAPGRGFAHPMPQSTPASRIADPFDEVDEQRAPAPAMHDDFFKGGEPADPWTGPSQPDHVDAPFHALPMPRTVSPPSLDDFDFDALLGDTPPDAGDPFAPAPARPSPPPAQAAAASPIKPAPPAAGPLVASLAPAPPAASPPPTAAPTSVPGAAQNAAQVAVQGTHRGAEQVGGQGVGSGAALAAFLDGAGMTQLRTDRDPEETLRAAGAVFRALVEGIREVLMSRAAIKNELRVEQTMMRARDNNALKFSVTPEEAMAALLLPERTGYKPALAAAHEAFADVRSHEMAVMAGMQTALLGLLRRFDPAMLEERLQPGRLDSFLPGARKARIWESFCATYKDIAREAEDDFQSVFGREFARAYEAQMKKL